MGPGGTRKTQSSPGASGWASYALLLNIAGSLFIWELAAAARSAASGKVPEVSLLQLPLRHIRGGITESDGNTHAGAAAPIEADDEIDDMALASRSDRPQTDTIEQVFKSTHVYRPSSSSTTTQRRNRQRRYAYDLGYADGWRDTYREKWGGNNVGGASDVRVGLSFRDVFPLERCQARRFVHGEKKASR